MARHAHPSRHGRLILRSLVDSPSPSEQPAEPESGPLEAAFTDPLAPAATTRKVHRGQTGPAPLGGTTLRAEAARLPSTLPHVAHVGQAERSVKPPRLSTSRESGVRAPGEARPKR